jgi:hypothetical protein
MADIGVARRKELQVVIIEFPHPERFWFSGLRS